MNSNIKTLFVMGIECMFALWLTPSQGQNHCELKKEQEGIKIYTCPTKESRFNAVKVEFEVNTTIDQYLAVALNVNDFSSWHYREINPKLLKKINENELIYHTQISAPFPVSNRDLVLHVTVNKDTLVKTSTIIIESVAHYVPEIVNIVRVPKSASRMTLQALSNSRLKVDYFIQVDPGGQLPAWLVNMFSTQAPYETFRNLIRKLEGQSR